MKLIKLVAQSLAVAGLVAAAAAGAATYTWTGSPTNLGAGGTGGSSAALLSQTYTYNDVTQNLSVTAKWSTTGANGAPEGAWLVLSDGYMPKSSPMEVPVYYIDWANGVNRVSAAQYDGTVYDGGGVKFGSWDNAVSVVNGTGTKQVSFNLSLAGINAYDPNGATPGQGSWKGGDFAANVGVWFHWFDQNTTTKTTYTGTAGNYAVSHIATLSESYYDTGGSGNGTSCSNTSTSGGSGTGGGSTCGCPPGSTTGTGTGGVPCGPTGGKVPVPGVALLMGVGLLGLGLSRRKFAISK